MGNGTGTNATETGTCNTATTTTTGTTTTTIGNDRVICTSRRCRSRHFRRCGMENVVVVVVVMCDVIRIAFP